MIVHSVDYGKDRELEYSRHRGKSNCFSSVVPIWSNSVLLPGCHKILEFSSFAQLCQLYLTGQLVETQDSFFLRVSSCSCRKRIPRVVLLLVSTWSNLVVHSSTFSSLLFICRTELVTPIRHCSVHTELISRLIWLEQEFCVHRISVEVNGTLTFLLLQDSTTEGTDAFEYKMTNFFEALHHFGGCKIPLPYEREKNWHTTSLPTLDPRMSNGNLIA